MKYFFAADLGATSGRTVIGSLQDGKVEIEEISRFKHPLVLTNGHYYWDILHIYNEIIRGLRKVAERGLELASIAVDTWGVDSVCIGSDGALLRAPRSYRDPATFEALIDYVDHIRTRRQLYDVTGIELMNFNSIFQYHAMRREGDVALREAEYIHFMPDALSWMLTGEHVCEYTIASTSELLNAHTRQLDVDLLSTLQLRHEQFGRMVMPGTVIGHLTEEVQKLTGLTAVPVVAVAGHDTQSAIAAIPAHDSHFAYLSSGTWSLMGIEADHAIINERSFELNFTNEGGVEGTTCFLKNICGMWLLESCRKEWTDAPEDYSEIIKAAMQQPAFRSIINPDSSIFSAPESMVEAIKTFCRLTGQHIPQGYAEITRCIFDSLVLRYKEVFQYLQEFSEHPLDVLHIIGGGSLNSFLNQQTADALNVEVLAGPTECTALGNVMLQAKAVGAVRNIWDMRQVVRNSVSPKHYTPSGNHTVWLEAYERYLTVTEDFASKYQKEQ